MRNHSKEILLIFLILSMFGCSKQTKPDANQLELLSFITETFDDSTTAMYHQTLEKQWIEKHIVDELTVELLTVNPVFTDINLDSVFTEQVFRELNSSFKRYQSYPLDSLNTELPYVVTEEQIPDFIITKGPPDRDAEFYRVVYISTPVATSNHGILFTHSSSGHSEIGVHFFIKKEGEWQKAGWTFTYPGILNND